MTIDQIIKIGALCTAIGVIFALINKVVLWLDKQKKQDERIDALETKHDKDINEIKGELQILIYSNLVSLKASQGDKTEVQKAVDMIEKHLNKKAHQ